MGGVSDRRAADRLLSILHDVRTELTNGYACDEHWCISEITAALNDPDVKAWLSGASRGTAPGMEKNSGLQDEHAAHDSVPFDEKKHLRDLVEHLEDMKREPDAHGPITAILHDGTRVSIPAKNKHLIEELERAEEIDHRAQIKKPSAF